MLVAIVPPAGGRWSHKVEGSSKLARLASRTPLRPLVGIVPSPQAGPVGSLLSPRTQGDPGLTSVQDSSHEPHAPPKPEARRSHRLVRAFALLAFVAAGASAFLLLTDKSSANTLDVGPGGYATISAAVQAASPGDTILIHAGTYHEQVNLNEQLTLQPYGDGPVILDEECARNYGVYIGGGSGQIIRGLTIKRTIGASIHIENFASHITVDSNTLQDFDCQELSNDQYRSGVASYYGGDHLTITNNTISRRVDLPGAARGWADGIWIKSSNSIPSGGGHYIADNTIIGGWDAIGSEIEYEAHGGLDKDSIIENNVIRDCDDDGISVEGGAENVVVRNNEVSGCGTGISFATPVTGPLYIENNYIHDLRIGDYKNLFCFKVGNGSSATVYLTENVCDVDSATEVSQGGADGVHQTNDGMLKLIMRNNTFRVSRYVYTFGYDNPLDYDSSMDYDCMWTTDPERFVKWAGNYWLTIEELRYYTGQEMHGRQGLDCSGPAPTRTPTPTPSRTSTPTPTGTANPTPTPASSYTPGFLPTTAPGTPVPDESPLVSAAMAPGWNYECYVGDSRPTEEAFATAAGRVSAAYRLGAGGVFDRWFANLPEVSTLTTVNPGDTLFVLTSDPFLWIQTASDTESTVDLAQGWNAVCYLGVSEPVQAATQGIVPCAMIYSLVGQTWQRFVPGRPEISNLSQLARFTPVLILVTDPCQWVFNP
jgi:parallel beta-helix repeat protein